MCCEGLAIPGTQCGAPPQGTLQLIKTTTGGDGTFAFTSTVAALGSPLLRTAGGTAQTAVVSVDPDTYTFTEAAAAGWDLTSIACTGNAAPATVDLGARTVSVPVAANENVVCTFTNTEVGKRTEAIIDNFMARRADMITSHGPSARRIVDRLSGGVPAESPGSLKDSDPTHDRGTGNMRTHEPMKLGGSGPQQDPGEREQLFTPTGVGGTGDGESSKITVSGSLVDIARAAHQREAMKLGAMAPAQHGAFLQPRFNAWMEGVFGYADFDKTQSSMRFGIANMGADYLVRPGLLVGVMTSLDTMSEKSAAVGYLVKGNGWMVGPYAGARLSEHLFLDSRIMWGRSSNEVSPFLTYTDSFDSERWLVAARLTGRWHRGPWSLTPSAEVIHFEDKSGAYVDSNGFTIGSQQVKLGRVIFGPEVSYRFTAADGTSVMPRLAAKGLWDFERPDILPIGGGAATSQGKALSGRLELGLSLTAPTGLSLDFEASHDGIGSSDLKSTAGKATLQIPLQ